MKIILIHGDHSLKSYERLQKLIKVARERDWEIIKIDSSSNLSFPEKFMTSDLFGKERLFILENLAKSKKSDLEWLRKNNERIAGTLIVYHSSILSKSQIKLLPQITKTEEYKLPKLIFKFLESFWPANSQNSIRLLHEVVKENAPEFVFNLLSRYLRDLYWTELDKGSMPYPSWRVGKLTQQAKRFKKDQIRELIRIFAEIDIQIKTSKASVIDSLDFIIASELE